MSGNIFFEIDLKCPICGLKFKGTKTKSKVRENTPMAYEPYLIPIYPEEKNNPLIYEIDVCPRCYYSAFHNDFKTFKKVSEVNMVKAFNEDIVKISKQVNFNTKYRNYELGRLSYILAAFIYEKEKRKSYLKLAKAYLRIAWFSKELKESDFYKTALKKALDTYVEAYNETEDFETTGVLLYLIGVIYMEIGDYQGAVPYFNKINGDQVMKKISTIKNSLENETIKLRKELKEINEEEKNYTDEQKKEARQKRKEAVKTKKYIEPFGIELSKVSIMDLESKGVIDKKELDNSFKKSFLKKPKVIIADDSRVIRNTVKYAIENFCNVVGEATNGNEVLQMYEVLKPNLVIMEIDMPGLSGIDVLKNLKKSYPESNIVFLSSGNNSELITEALKIGAKGYLLKPLNVNKLMDILKKS